MVNLAVWVFNLTWPYCLIFLGKSFNNDDENLTTRQRQQDLRTQPKKPGFFTTILRPDPHILAYYPVSGASWVSIHLTRANLVLFSRPWH